MTCLRKKPIITQKDIFSQQVCNGANTEKMFWIYGNFFFGQTSEPGQIL